jgi:ribonuclease HII
MNLQQTRELRFHIDEAGRGPLAGPVFVGVILPLKQFDTSLFQDSKQLSEKQRETAYTKILELEEE